MEKIWLPLHLLSLAFVTWNIVIADHLGFSWMRGRVLFLDKNKIQKYHHRSWIGLCLMIITGFFLFLPLKEYLLTRPQFYIKMAFVVTLIINGFAIGHLQKISFTKSFKELTSKEKLPLFISGAVSTICWIMAALAALYLVAD